MDRRVAYGRDVEIICEPRSETSISGVALQSVCFRARPLMEKPEIVTGRVSRTELSTHDTESARLGVRYAGHNLRPEQTGKPLLFTPTDVSKRTKFRLCRNLTLRSWETTDALNEFLDWSTIFEQVHRTSLEIDDLLFQRNSEQLKDGRDQIVRSNWRRVRHFSFG